MIDPAILDLISGLPLHSLMLIAIIVLWRENRRLTAKIEDVRQVAASAHGLILNQSAQIHDLTSQKVDWKGNEVPTPPNPWNS
jgi:hypothetical protein